MDVGLRNSLFLCADEVQVGWKAYHNDVLQFGKKAGLLRTLESVVFGMFPCLVCETWLWGSTPPANPRPTRFAQQLLSRPQSQNPLTAVHLVHLDGQTSQFHPPGQHLLNAICLFIYCCKGA